MRKLLAAFGALVISSSALAQSQNFQIGRWMEIQNYILKSLGSSYVDTLPVAKMQRAAIDAMLKELDPYTIYVPEDEVEDFSMRMMGVYGGIGAVIFKEEGRNVVLNEPYEGSPCVKAGLESGDEILYIDGTDVKPLDTKTCSDMMKGQAGTTVNFVVKKVHSGDTLNVNIKREIIHLSDVEYAGMLDSKTGYILQTGFTEGVGETVRQKVRELKDDGMEKLVLDLRGNGGGLMNEAVEIVSIFVPKGSLVVTAKGRNDEVRDVYYTTKDPLDVKLPLIVLVDGGSASASEIVSGALQDLDRATIIGQRTFGKGLVQSIKPLPYGGQLKLTVAHYYTPSGRCVQAIDYFHRDKEGKAQHIPDSLANEFRTSKGRIVRDGGGITPDVVLEIPVYDDIVYSLVLGGVVGQYALDYKMRHDKVEPVETFEFTDFDDFREYARKFIKEEALDQLDSLKNEQIKPFIEEEIMVRYYYQEAGVRLRLRYDTMLKEALTKEPAV